MTKQILGFVLAISLSGIALAQNSNDYTKYEFFAGYSNGQANEGKTYNGFNVAAVRNVHRYFGVKADFSGTYQSGRESFQVTTNGVTQSFSNETRSSIYNVLGGVQIKDNASKARFKPFVHALAGVGHRRFQAKNSTCTPGPLPCTDFSFGRTGFAAVLGGGLDIKINKKIDFRAFQIDYNPMIFNGHTDHNARFGIGFVFK
jgi:opacity protein-like surface antigen